VREKGSAPTKHWINYQGVSKRKDVAEQGKKSSRTKVQQLIRLGGKLDSKEKASLSRGGNGSAPHLQRCSQIGAITQYRDIGFSKLLVGENQGQNVPHPFPSMPVVKIAQLGHQSLGCYGQVSIVLDISKKIIAGMTFVRTHTIKGLSMSHQ